MSSRVLSSHAPLTGHIKLSNKIMQSIPPIVKTQKHPIDFDKLKKGDFISQQELSVILNIDPSEHQAFSFAVMGLKQMIEDRTEFVLRQVNNGLEIMTDAQAVRYLWQRSEKANRDKRKAYYKLIDKIDIDNLTIKQVEDYNHKATIIGAEISAANNSRKTIIVSPKR